MAKYTWVITWADGTRTEVPAARGPNDAHRRAWRATGRTDGVQVEKHLTGRPFVRRIVGRRTP
jgi:hypothetical protein